MSTIIQSLHRDNRDVERVLRVLEQECDAFFHAERPDYPLLGELIEHLDVFFASIFVAKAGSFVQAGKKVGCHMCQNSRRNRGQANQSLASLKALSNAL
jgi:hypothetical protein